MRLLQCTHDRGWILQERYFTTYVMFLFVLHWFCDATTDGHLLKHLEHPWSIVSSTWHRFPSACSVLAASFRFIFGISFEALQYFNQFFQVFVLAASFWLSFWVTGKSEGQLQSVWAAFMTVLGLFLSTLVISSTCAYRSRKTPKTIIIKNKYIHNTKKAQRQRVKGVVPSWNPLR